MGEPRIVTTTCPSSDRDACVEGARAAFGQRWRRALERSDDAGRVLCGGDGNVGDRLLVDQEGLLEEVLAALRVERCASPPASG